MTRPATSRCRTSAPTCGASSTQQLWIIDIYGFMLAGFLITMGTLGDRIGRRRLLLIGGARVRRSPRSLAAFSTSAEMLIAARAAARHRRRHPDAVHAGADQQHVPRPAAARRWPSASG